VWIFDQPNGGGGEVVTDVRLVDLSGRVVRSFRLDGYQSSATPDHVLVGRGGRVYTADEDGLRVLATGWLNGAIGHGAIITGCDDDGDCSLQLHPTDGRPPRVLVDIDDPDAVYYDTAAVAADGRAAIVGYSQTDGGRHVLLVDASGARLGQVDVPVSFEGGGVPAWLPGELGLVISSGSGLSWIRPTGSGWEVTPLDLPREVVRGAEAVFVLTPAD
jgi:hypothetical protein